MSFQKNYIIIILLSIYSWDSIASSIIDSTDVYGTWAKAGSPYLIFNDINIPADTSLTIEPGVLIIFYGHYNMKAQGGLIASGNENDTILFSIKDTTGFEQIDSSAGGWNGIDINQPINSTFNINFSFCKFEYSKRLGTNSGGAIGFINNSKTAIINHCDFSHNYAYYGGCISYDGAGAQGDLQITYCSFDRNEAYIGGAIKLWWYNHTHVISHNTFSYNQANMGGALYMSGGKIDHNLFYMNQASAIGGAIWTGGGSSLIIENSVFNGNKANYGAAYYASAGTFNSKLINCTLIDNIADSSVLYISGNSVNNIQVINTINWNPGSVSILRQSSQTNIVVNYSIIQNASDSSWFVGSCIDLDPKIIAPDHQNYNLNWDSPAINAGSYDTTGLHLDATDFYDNPRIENGRIDIGAVEYDSSLVSISQNKIIQDEISIYPNPSSDQIKIESTDKNSLLKEVILYDLSGRALISEKVNDSIKVLKLNDLMSGTYLLNVSFVNGYSYSKQIIKK